MAPHPIPPAPSPAAAPVLWARLLDALPQTQCTRCGYPDCEAYARAIAHEQAPINRCPPGGQAGVQRLAQISGQAALPLDPACGQEGPRQVAWIDEAWCIGCTLCLDVCPTDAIIGSHKRMHTVLEEDCTGCELCLPVCPVDCIALDNVTGTRTGWDAWSAEQAQQARARYAQHQARLARQSDEAAERREAKAEMKLADLSAHTQLPDGPEREAELARKRAIIEAALAKSRAQRAKPPGGTGPDGQNPG